MNPLIAIPARMKSARLPGKPMADIHGDPMITHVWRRARETELGPVVVACCEQEVFDAVTAAGGDAVMTDPDLPSGSDRIWAAVQAFDPGGRHDVVINLQGDLPTIAPETIAAVLAPLATDSGIDIATLAAPIGDAVERADPNVVKAVLALGEDGQSGRALYFSRLPAPLDGPHYHHIGVYAYRRAALRRFVSLPPAALERSERLEQLRALVAGMRIGAALVDAVPIGVDTPADLDRARANLAPTAPPPIGSPSDRSRCFPRAGAP